MKDTGSIFLIENDKDFIYRLEQAFRRANIRNPVKTARYGDEAILYLKGVGIYQDRRTYPIPSLVILDMTNPDGSSMGVLSWLQEQPDFGDVPILVLTDGEPGYQLRELLDAGANAFVISRNDLDDLVRTIMNLELLNLERRASFECKTRRTTSFVFSN
jgi:CheY-like chemotaxis protein